MKVNEYLVLQDCIERGVESGYNRAHKHSNEPSPEELKWNISTAVAGMICEYFTFEGSFCGEEINQA